ncbi:MAG: hypothetical protein AAGG44_21470, partial [Planctomycetota bacterium]
VIGPMCVLQMVNGLLGLLFRPRHVGRATAIVGLLPLSPVWILSLPVGIWALIWLKKDSQAVGAPSKQAILKSPSPANQGWGATTMMFVRESRWGKLVAAGNVLAALVACGLLVGWKQGWYPTTAEFRIVSSDASGSQIMKAIRARAGDYITGHEEDGKIKFYVRGSGLQELQDLVAIEDGIRLTWIRGSSVFEQGPSPLEETAGEDDPAGPIRYDIATGLTLPNGYAHSTELGSVAIAQIEGEEIRPDYFTNLSCSGSRLTLELTRQGLEKLTDELSSRDSDWLPALISDEVVIAVGKPQKGGRRGLEFTLANNDRLNARSVEAAIRGPAIGSPLEYLGK